MSTTPSFQVGATVRLPRPEVPKSTGRATIATLQGDDQTACVIWESLAPEPISFNASTCTVGKPKRRLKRPFLVAPVMDRNDTDETETTVELCQLQALLDFELTSEKDSDDVAVWKERGDQLLRLGDASAACSYYEAALRLSSILQVGSAIVMKAGGHAKIADVDCLDDDDDEEGIEISLADGQDLKISEADIYLCILYNDDEEHLQERILLNLTRCMLQLAELAKHVTSRPQYFKSAVIASTLALTIGNHHKEEEDNNNNLTSLEQTALLLRGQAQGGLAKFQHAIADTKRLLQYDPNHKQAKKQWQSLQGQQQKQKQVDKKLVKSMCQWVQTATDDDPKLLG